MGGQKHKWTGEEKEALRAGVAKHGIGKWKTILQDPQFRHSLAARTNVDLKDKWRNMCVFASGQGSRDKSKSPTLEALPALPVANSNAPSSLPAAEDATTDVAADPSKSPVEGKWRNMCVSASGQGSLDKLKSPTLKALPALPVANSKAPSSLPAAKDATADVAMDPSKSPVDGKWRNMRVSASGQGSLDKFKSPTLKALSALPVANSNAPSSLPAAEDATTDVAMDPSKSPVDGKWRYKCASASSQGSRDKFKSPKLKALPDPLVANSNTSSSLPVAQGATTDVAMDPSKSPVDGKWKNMCVSASVQGSCDKFKSPKLKALPDPLVANSNASSSLPVEQDAAADVAMDPSKSPVDGKPAPRYNALIFEAISTSKDLNGPDINAIISFIEQRTEVPKFFRKVLSSKLRRFVNQGKLEKVQNRYRIQKAGVSGQKIPTTSNPKEDQHVKQSQTPPAGTQDEKREEAKKHTAHLVADTENKSFLASEAVKEAERYAKMVEEAQALHLFAKEIFERTSRGEDVSVA